MNVSIEPFKRLHKLLKTFLTPQVRSLFLTGSIYISCFVYKMFNLRGVADWKPVSPVRLQPEVAKRHLAGLCK